MRKSLTPAVIALAAGMMLIADARAQQTPAANPQPAPRAVVAKTPKPPAAKTGQAPAAKTRNVPALVTQNDKASYTIGLNIGKGLKRDFPEVAPNILLRGLKDALAGGKTLLTDDEIKATTAAFQADLTKKQGERIKQLGETNQKDGEAFLAANQKKDGVVTLPSGLQYKILSAGTGPKPSAGDSVVCNYRGTLIDNTEFDSSYKRGQPATFPVGQVIKGWTEALQLMPVGSKWQLFLPPQLAYGERGSGATIGPNATLIFEVELISIQGK